MHEKTPQRKRMTSMHEGFDSQQVTPSNKKESLVCEDIDDPDNVLDNKI